MPFTAAHPAAVLPLANRFPRLLPWSGLVIGSIAPDFVYFTLGKVTVTSHSPLGLVEFCLPVGILIWLVFHLIVKRPLAYLLPDRELGYLWEHATRRIDLSLQSLAAVALAVMVGAASHILWDSFTHDGGWAVAHIEALGRTITVVDGYRFTAYRLVQHGSTVVGFVLLAIAYRRWRRQQVPVDLPPRMTLAWRLRFLSVLVMVPFVLATVYMLTGARPLIGLESATYWVWRFVTSGIGFGLASVLLYSMVVRVAEARLTTLSARAA